MTNKEQELLSIIRQQDNPEQAIDIALRVIVSYLNRLEPSESTPFVDSRESA